MGHYPLTGLYAGIAVLIGERDGVPSIVARDPMSAGLLEGMKGLCEMGVWLGLMRPIDVPLVVTGLCTTS